MSRRRPTYRRHPWENPSINRSGGSRAWTRLRNRVIREEPWCRLRLPGCTGVSTTADHIKPKKHYPQFAMERWNLRGSCRSCNMLRGTGTGPFGRGHNVSLRELWNSFKGENE